MPLKAVFFDIDGTLVDSNEQHVMAWDEALRHHGFVVARDDIRAQIGKGWDQLLPALVPQADGPAQKDIAQRHGKIFRLRYLGDIRPFPHATDLVEMVHAQGRHVVLASSAGEAEVEHYIRLLNIKSLINDTVTKDDVARSKPAGDIFAAALAQVFPTNASETLAIGDTPYDIELASRSGIATLALRSGGFSEEVLGSAGAAYVYASVGEVFENFAASPLAN